MGYIFFLFFGLIFLTLQLFFTKLLGQLFSGEYHHIEYEKCFFYYYSTALCIYNK